MARSSMMREARKFSLRLMIVTLVAKRVRKSASSMAESPPPMTAISLPRAKKPSQVAQELTPWPMSACSQGRPSQRAEAPEAMMSERVRTISPPMVSSKGDLQMSTEVRWPMGDLGAEARGLLLHVVDELGALDAVGPAGEVFDQRGDGELAAGLVAFEDERLEVGARGVDGGGQPGAAGAQDDGVANGGFRHSYLIVEGGGWVQRVQEGQGSGNRDQEKRTA